jgi:hypothetical protein
VFVEPLLFIMLFVTFHYSGLEGRRLTAIIRVGLYRICADPGLPTRDKLEPLAKAGIPDVPLNYT